MQPVGIQLGDAAIKIRDCNLKLEQPTRPLRRPLASQRRITQSVDGQFAIGRQKDSQETQQANQVVMIQVPANVHQEHPGVANEEHGGGKSIPESQQDTHRRDTEDREMNVHSAAGPGLDEVESWPAEMVSWFDIVGMNQVGTKVLPDLPQQAASQCNSVECQPVAVDGPGQSG